MNKSELEIVKDIRNRFLLPKNLGIGIGDDAALFKLKKPALFTTDLMIEGVHFDLAYTSFYHLGFKIVSVNVSDIYAMGGDFRGFLFSAGLPKTISDAELKDLFDGIDRALSYYSGYLIGGDLSRSERLVLSGFAVGECDKPVLRGSAQPGDGIFITAPTGLSSAGFNLLNSLTREEKDLIKKIRDFEKFRELDEKFGSNISELIERHLMPKARNPNQFKDIAKAMMDISDGLLIDLHRLCEESDVGAEIYLDKLPIVSSISKTAEYLNTDPMNFVLSGGEDYELLVISDEDKAKDFDLIHIGRIVKTKGIYLLDQLKRRISVKPEGWQHF